MSSIRLEGVAFAYTDAVALLDDVSLHITSGITGVVGANGAGKSTLVRLIAGELRPTRGHLEVHGDVVVCPQQLTDDPLSPGERRRAQVGAALAAHPDVLVLDEPTNHLDRTARTRLVGMLRRFSGIALVISHDRALLDELTSSTIRVHAGTAQLYPAPYSAAKQLWEADQQRARDVRDDARRTARKAQRRLADARRDQQHAEASRGGGARKRNRHDHDATAIGARHVWCAVLDEPTNHLDLPSIERLEAALAAFPGALVLVTHDDAFAAHALGARSESRICTRTS